jgi:hypothetical protein
MTATRFRLQLNTAEVWNFNLNQTGVTAKTVDTNGVTCSKSLAWSFSHVLRASDQTRFHRLHYE